MPFNKEEYQFSSGNGHNVRLSEPMIYRSREGEEIAVPEGTVSDGASTPRIFWRALPPFGPYWRPALMHDYLYQSGLFCQAKCDSLFHEAMLDCHVNRFKAWVIYAGVRMGGWIAYRNYRKKERLK
jgi:hypothetical protein